MHENNIRQTAVGEPNRSRHQTINYEKDNV